MKVGIANFAVLRPGLQQLIGDVEKAPVLGILQFVAQKIGAQS